MKFVLEISRKEQKQLRKALRGLPSAVLAGAQAGLNIKAGMAPDGALRGMAEAIFPGAEPATPDDRITALLVGDVFDLLARYRGDVAKIRGIPLEIRIALLVQSPASPDAYVGADRTDVARIVGDVYADINNLERVALIPEEALNAFSGWVIVAGFHEPNAHEVPPAPCNCPECRRASP